MIKHRDSFAVAERRCIIVGVAPASQLGRRSLVVLVEGAKPEGPDAMTIMAEAGKRRSWSGKIELAMIEDHRAEQAKVGES